MSAGAIGSRATVPRWAEGSSRMTGLSPAARSTFCTTTLWIDHHAGIATDSPARSATSVMSGRTVSEEPLVWFQAVIRTSAPSP